MRLGSKSFSQCRRQAGAGDNGRCSQRLHSDRTTSLVRANETVPAGQPRNDFYSDYRRHAARLDAYIESGGTLLLELNGAEGMSLVLPRGVKMTWNGGRENAIMATNHPVFVPFGTERTIRANYASHGYLTDVPEGAVVLAVEAKDGK